MNRIVKKHFPVEKLPAELREGLPEGGYVDVTVDVEGEEQWDQGLENLSLEDIFRLVPDHIRRSAEDLDAALEDARKEWDQ